MTIEAPETQVVTTWKVACDGGEGALGDIAAKMASNPQLAGIANMLDRDGDGNPLDDIAGIAKGLFGKD